MNKQQKKLLVTALGGDLGTDTVRCYRDQKPDLLIVGIDANSICGSKHLVDSFYQAPLVTRSDDYKQFIRNLIERESIGTILPSSEIEIGFFNRHRSDFQDVHLLIQSANVLEISLDKLRTITWLTSIGVAVPKTVPLSNYDGGMTFPLILKERSTSGGQGVFLVNSLEELNVRACKMKECLVQEHVGSIDEEYTVGVCADRKSIFDIQFKRKLGLSGLSHHAKVVNEVKLKDLSHRIAESLELLGPINIQCRKVKDDFIPFEINSRLSSLVFARSKLGFHDAAWWYDLANDDNYHIDYKRKNLDVDTVIRVVREVFLMQDGSVYEL